MRSAKPNWRRTYQIGRSPSADVVLSHDGVSRRHARLVLDAQGGLYLDDLGSKHGTFVHRGGGWQRLSHDFVGADEPLRFGLHRTTLAQLLEQIGRRPGNQSTTASVRDVRYSHRDAIVLVADVVGYSRMMNRDPDGTLDALNIAPDGASRFIPAIGICASPSLRCPIRSGSLILHGESASLFVALLPRIYPR